MFGNGLNRTVLQQSKLHRSRLISWNSEVFIDFSFPDFTEKNQRRNIFLFGERCWSHWMFEIKKFLRLGNVRSVKKRRESSNSIFCRFFSDPDDKTIDQVVDDVQKRCSSVKRIEHIGIHSVVDFHFRWTIDRSIDVSFSGFCLFEIFIERSGGTRLSSSQQLEIQR